jgi:hypothetical protein
MCLALACLSLNDAAAASPDGRGQGWRTEPGVSPPSYAVTEPVESEVNVDTIALVCGETACGRSLELDLYVTGPGPLLPNGADPRQLKELPSVEIVIDGRRFRADLLFADKYVVVADASDHRWPVLSTHLLDAMQNGRSMVLRFDLLEKRHEAATRFDSYLVIDLQAGQWAIEAVRRCTSPDAYLTAR